MKEIVVPAILVLWAIMAITAACPILLGLFFGLLLFLGWRLLWLFLAWWFS